MAIRGINRDDGGVMNQVKYETERKTPNPDGKLYTYKVISLRLPQSQLADKVIKEANEIGVGPSEYIRYILVEHFKQQEEKKQNLMTK